jgi:hypothetical protein
VTVVHRIRLRGSWAVTPLPDGRFRHVRRFGRPRTLDPDETLWVACGAAAVSVNGVAMAGEGAFDVTGLLQPRNELAIETAAEGEPEVVLEVRKN